MKFLVITITALASVAAAQPYPTSSTAYEPTETNVSTYEPTETKPPTHSCTEPPKPTCTDSKVCQPPVVRLYSGVSCHVSRIAVQVADRAGY